MFGSSANTLLQQYAPVSCSRFSSSVIQRIKTGGAGTLSDSANCSHNEIPNKESAPNTDMATSCTKKIPKKSTQKWSPVILLPLQLSISQLAHHHSRLSSVLVKFNEAQILQDFTGPWCYQTEKTKALEKSFIHYNPADYYSAWLALRSCEGLIPQG